MMAEFMANLRWLWIEHGDKVAVVAVVSIVIALVVLAWFRSGIEENKAIDAEWERFKDDLYK